MFKYLLLLLCSWMPIVSTSAQSPDAQRFLASFTEQVMAIAAERGLAADALSSNLSLTCSPNSQGTMQWEVAPTDSLTHAVAVDALARVGETCAVSLDGVDAGVYTTRIPVEKLAATQQITELRFQGEEAAHAFPRWADEQLRARGATGSAEVRFFIEPDGWVALGVVIASSSPKFTREVLRVVRASRDKWTARRVRGIAQRTSFDYRTQVQ